MSNGKEMRARFWKELDDSPFVMIGLTGVNDSHTQPMTAQFDDDLPNRIYFYTNRQNRLVSGLAQNNQATLSYTSKGHDFFGCVHGTLSLDNDKAVIDKFWSPIVSAWFEGGKDDPDLCLLRFDAGRAELWQAGTANFLKYMAAGLFGDSADDASQDDVVETHF